jgi:hypothetical protein
MFKEYLIFTAQFGNFAQIETTGSSETIQTAVIIAHIR